MSNFNFLNGLLVIYNVLRFLFIYLQMYVHNMVK